MQKILYFCTKLNTLCENALSPRFESIVQSKAWRGSKKVITDEQREYYGAKL